MFFLYIPCLFEASFYLKIQVLYPKRAVFGSFNTWKVHNSGFSSMYILNLLVSVCVFMCRFSVSYFKENIFLNHSTRRCFFLELP